MSEVLKILENKAGAQKTKGIPGRRLNKPLQIRRYLGALGVEIELEGRNLPTAGYLDGVRTENSRRGWEVKNDGSLRGGLEYVTSPEPCEPEEIPHLINGLFRVFAQRGTQLRPSNRCSLHVHYNAGGLKVNQVTSIFALWTIFEEPLLRTWGDARYKNHFCLSSKDEASNVEEWSNFLRTGQLPQSNGLRYTALNLVALRKYGSLEFRGGGAVETPDKAIRWVLLLHALCEYAKNKYHNPQNIAYDLSERGAAAILEDICGEQFAEMFHEILNAVPDFTRSCGESFYNIQPILLGFPWTEWCEEIDKPYVPNPFGKEESFNPRAAGAGPERVEFEWNRVVENPRRNDERELLQAFVARRNRAVRDDF